MNPLSYGMVEIKCPYSKREMTPEEACGDSLFCCELVDADICIFTCKGIAVQRIKPDHDWQKKHIPELESYFDDYIFPELASPQHKPNYYL